MNVILSVQVMVTGPTEAARKEAFERCWSKINWSHARSRSYPRGKAEVIAIRQISETSNPDSD